MTTKLDHALKREVLIGGAPYTVTIDPQGLKLVPKGKRKGYELAWDAFVSGEAALATALNASIAAAPEPPSARKSSPPPSAQEKPSKVVKPSSSREKPQKAKPRKAPRARR
jgi:hypothetical protein